MNDLLAMSANIRAARECGKAEALSSFASRFATFSAARGKAAPAAQVASHNDTQQAMPQATASAPAGVEAATDGNGGDGEGNKRRRGRKPKGGK